MGPCTIFDKSALQSFSMDESVWFDEFMAGNITPLFYVETLADLEKSIRGGKSPEELVGMLAYKTPWNAVPNVHHKILLESELMEGKLTGLDGSGRPIIGGAKPKKNADGTFSIHFDEFPEAAALNRWHNGEFLEIERSVAKQWRINLNGQNQDAQINKVKYILPKEIKLSNLEQLKEQIDIFCESNDIHVLQLALEINEVPQQARQHIIERWKKEGQPALAEFAPYLTHVFKVDLLYYLGIDRGFISGTRASNKVDMAYLYYLPFCMVFVSGDKLHQRTAPLFLREDQTFTAASEMKAALKEFDDYFDSLPDEVKKLGVMHISGYPPAHLNNAVTDIWDKNMRPDWRKISDDEKESRLEPPSQNNNGKAFGKDINEIYKTAVDIDPDTVPSNTDDVEQMFITRKMPLQKGKWRMLSDEQEKAIEESKNDQE
jgi:hypothetical protein